MHSTGMTTDITLVYLGASVQLKGVNRFYTRRVLQRCKRGEITLHDAAQLLIAAAQHGVATVQVVGVQTNST
jgi:hypothetical protein